MDELAGAKRKKPLDDVRRFHIWGQPFGAAAALLGGVFVGLRADGNAFGRRPEGRQVAAGVR